MEKKENSNEEFFEGYTKFDKCPKCGARKRKKSPLCAKCAHRVDQW